MSYSIRAALRKILLGVALVAAAAGISLFIKENMDVRDPEAALPTLTISVNGTPIAQDTVFRAGYSWNFWMMTEKNTPVYTDEELTKLVYPVEVQARSIIKLDFSTALGTLKISRADDEGFHYYIEMSDVVDDQIIAPATAGQYMYKIEAGFGARGSIIYYLRVNVNTV